MAFKVKESEMKRGRVFHKFEARRKEGEDTSISVLIRFLCHNHHHGI